MHRFLCIIYFSDNILSLLHINSLVIHIKHLNPIHLLVSAFLRPRKTLNRMTKLKMQVSNKNIKLKKKNKKQKWTQKQNKETKIKSLRLHFSHLSIAALFLWMALGAAAYHAVRSFDQTALLVNICCVMFCLSCPKPLASGTPSLLDSHRNSTWISCCCPNSWRSWSYGSSGPFPSLSPASYRWGRCWGAPT